MPVYLTLQKNLGDKQAAYDRTIAIQQCGDYPYELASRFAGCCLRCSTCFAADYSWQDRPR